MPNSTAKKPYLDTSIFMEVFKLNPNDAKKFLSKISSSGGAGASYFTLIELNKYFIWLAIHLHRTVMDLRDAPSAKIKLSNDWGRASKYYLILDALIMRNATTDYYDDYKKYAAILETIIVDLQDRMYNMVQNFYGVHAGHPIVKSRVFGASDFQDHMDTVKNAEIDYAEAWAVHNKQIIAADQYFSALPKKTIVQKDIHELIKQLLADPGGKQKKHYGDFLIALDAPKNSVIYAYDKVFTKAINDSLSKEGLYVNPGTF